MGEFTLSKSSKLLLAIVLANSVVFAGTPARVSRSTNVRVAKDEVRGSAPSVVPEAVLAFCAESCAGQTAFKVRELRDLVVFVSWKNVQGAHVQQLRLLLPNGDLYQDFESRFDTTAGMQIVAGLPTTTTVVPVAGSSIEQRQLTGTWIVQAVLDGKVVSTSKLKLIEGSN